jgi:pyruvoyl-dependent arginine decarboxylase (PvlArgDC)
MKPFLIENYDITSKKKTYEFVEKLPGCSKKEIGQTIQVIDSTIAAPYDGKTYFKSIYSSFFRLRDCAKDDSGYVLSVLRKYQESGAFDGEVAETLVSVIDEVELIAVATK